jgi:hypothetical protein
MCRQTRPWSTMRARMASIRQSKRTKYNEYKCLYLVIAYPYDHCAENATMNNPPVIQQQGAEYARASTDPSSVLLHYHIRATLAFGSGAYVPDSALFRFRPTSFLAASLYLCCNSCSYLGRLLGLLCLLLSVCITKLMIEMYTPDVHLHNYTSALNG